MLTKHLLTLLLTATTLGFTSVSHAQSNAAIDEIAGYLDFSEYGGGVIFAEQIPREAYKDITIIDARDPAQFAQAHIPGAINIEWRQVLNERDQIPKDKMVLIYCNTGSLSAQGGLALRVAGWDNVRILQGGFEEWKKKAALTPTPVPQRRPSISGSCQPIGYSLAITARATAAVSLRPPKS
uniref:rhodanese-like domain-containing protein n=1 Tax=Orrella sp. TaxID=1921583 RepID=UPI0040475906